MAEMGRPRTHDRDQIAKELIEWAQLPDSINLCGFCCSRQPPIAPQRITQWASECDHFQEAYWQAKAFIGARREVLLSKDKLHVKAYDLNARTYDEFLKQEMKETEAYKAKLTAEAEGAKQSTYNIMASNDLTAGTYIPTPAISTQLDQGAQ